MESRKIDTMALVKKYGIFIVLVTLWVVFSLSSSTFRTADNFSNILRQVSTNGIIAVGMTFIIMVGGIDLSVGSQVAVAGVIGGSILVANPGNTVFAVIASVVVCCLFGVMNGFFVAKGKVPAFIVTLATMTMARGFAYVYSDGKPYTLKSPNFNLIGKGNTPIIIFIVIVILAHILLSQTKFGRYVYATGGNEDAASASGVNVKSILMRVYILCGVLTGIAGVILAARTNSGQPAVGQGYELDAIAAVVIGGTSMTGGSGTILGTLVGVLIIGTLNNGLNLMDVSSYYQMIVKGIIILGAVFFDLKSKKAAK
ncbi:ABC transporter permease [Caproiciproducens sp.]|uniref:ABC transporter permease n=1 Tax=Caproiciproducens sp. TaxID=1954376 RepID=UPI002896EFC8|nr:ABC transporter permease [Caproiciproducens sp.]